jgi:hypothetical protein
MSHNDIIKAVMDLNEDVLKFEQVKQMATFIPNANDVS